VRILFVSSEHASAQGTGGVGSYVATITKALAQRGNDVHVLSCRAGASVDDGVEDGVAIHFRPLVRVPGLARVVRGERTRQALLLAASNFWHARALGSFDVIEAPDWQAEGLVFALRQRTPVVAHLHTPLHVLKAFNDEPLDLDARCASWLERLAVRRAARITCPARLLVDLLRSQGWLRSEPVDIIRYPVDWRRFAELPAPSATGRSVLYVGRLERRKAPERLLHAVARVRADGNDAEVVFVGRGSGVRDGVDYGEWTRELARRLGVPCTFVGETAWSDVPRRYADSRVVCVPSEFESFSMTAVEGMAAGRPVVVTASVGAAEVLGADEFGQVVPTDPEGMAKALGRFMSEGDDAAAVGMANRAVVAAECDPDDVARRREDLYRRIACAS